MSFAIEENVRKLVEHHLTGFDRQAGMVFPNYSGYSLANIPDSICRWLGAEPIRGRPLAEEVETAFGGPFKRVVLCVIDALGWQRFQTILTGCRNHHAELDFWPRWLENGMIQPLTSISPSTTAAAITTLWTGATPAEHGVVGYEVWLKEYSMVANMIQFGAATFRGDSGGLRRAGFRPDTFMTLPTLGSHLSRQGIKTYVGQHESIARSGLSEMLMQGVSLLPYHTLSDLWQTLGNILGGSPDERLFVYAYWGDLDALQHFFGPDDIRVDLEMAAFTLQFANFWRRMRELGRGDTLVLFTADHGQAFTPPNPRYELHNHPELVSMLAIPPSGEARFTYLFPRSTKEDAVSNYIKDTWPGEFLILRGDAAIAAGLLGDGNLHPRLADRVGDLVVVPKGRSYLRWSEKENAMCGRHGGLSPAEMLVPLFGSVV